MALATRQAVINKLSHEKTKNIGLRSAQHHRSGYPYNHAGTFGRVRLVKHKQTNKFYAAKILKKFDIQKSKQIDHVQN